MRSHIYDLGRVDEPPSKIYSRRDVLKILGLGTVVSAADVRSRSIDPIQPVIPSAGHSLEKLHIRAGTAILPQMRDHMVFPEGRKWEITANAEGFCDVGKNLVSNPATAALLHQKEIKLLCPAGGNLLSPLEIAFQIAEGSNQVDRVHFAITEIDIEKYRSIDQLVQSLVSACDNTTHFQVRQEYYPRQAQSTALWVRW